MAQSPQRQESASHSETDDSHFELFRESHKELLCRPTALDANTLLLAMANSADFEHLDYGVVHKNILAHLEAYPSLQLTQVVLFAIANVTTSKRRYVRYNTYNLPGTDVQVHSYLWMYGGKVKNHSTDLRRVFLNLAGMRHNLHVPETNARSLFTLLFRAKTPDRASTDVFFCRISPLQAFSYEAMSTLPQTGKQALSASSSSSSGEFIQQAKDVFHFWADAAEEEESKADAPSAMEPTKMEKWRYQACIVMLMDDFLVTDHTQAELPVPEDTLILPFSWNVLVDMMPDIHLCAAIADVLNEHLYSLERVCKISTDAKHLPRTKPVPGTNKPPPLTLDNFYRLPDFLSTRLAFQMRYKNSRDYLFVKVDSFIERIDEHMRELAGLKGSLRKLGRPRKLKLASTDAEESTEGGISNFYDAGGWTRLKKRNTKRKTKDSGEKRRRSKPKQSKKSLLDKEEEQEEWIQEPEEWMEEGGLEEYDDSADGEYNPRED